MKDKELLTDTEMRKKRGGVVEMNDEDDTGDQTETAEEAAVNEKAQRLGEMVEKNILKFANRQIDDHGLDAFILMLALIRVAVNIGGRHLGMEETTNVFRTTADDLEEFGRKRSH